MKKVHTKYLTGLAVSVSAMAMVAGAPAYAQDTDDECEVNAQGQADEDCEQPVRADGVVSDDAGDLTPVVDSNPGAYGEVNNDGAIVVTGSRIRQDTYSSISPLQVLSTEAERDVGNFDAAQILQRSEAAAGTQIDATFQGFVLNNGPGSQTLDLRGLGADRTLLLVNGRRLAPAGVEGAPTNPSINLIPASLVARYDLLLDGASSVYGSDAVAGVGNIILRTDIDGVELFASGNINEQGGGDDYTLSAAYGKTFDRGFFGIGFEYSKRDEVRIGDRDFLSGCNTNYEIDQDGNIYTVGVADNANTLADSGGTIQERTTPCKIEAAVRRIIPGGNLFFGSIYADPTVYDSTGQAGNTGIPGFSDAFDAFGDPVDRNGDGFLDVDFTQVSRNGTDLTPSFISPQDLYNVMAYGEYELGTSLNITPFFEANYSRSEVSARSTVPQLFPYVPANNQFNPCNFIDNPNGVDCAAAQNQFDGLDTYAGGDYALPEGVRYVVRPVVSVRGDRSFVETTLEQYRGVLGVRGDLPFINDSWTFEVSGVYSRSIGKSSRAGIRGDRLALALGIDPTSAQGVNAASPVVLPGGACATSGFQNPDILQPDVVDGCVPVNLFAPSLYDQAVGDFATQAERDYLFDSRDFDTVYEQTVISAYTTGDIVELPAGPLSVVVGGEYRYDKLDSQPDAVAAQGLFFGYFADQGGEGNKYILEGFGEVNLPVFSNDFLGDFEVNASGRISKDEYYGTNETYSLKGGWRPVPAVLLKISYGTSFRAPNLRENFLAGQSGFGGLTDPCAVPSDAFFPLGGGYSAADDNRDQQVLENCRREGRDPTRVGIDSGGSNTVQVPSVEITSGGSLDLDPETSTSLTAGVAVSESYGNFDFAFNFNYFDIQVEGAIAEPTGQFVVNQCFLRDDGVRSNYCDSIDYDTDPASRQLITDVFAGFVNINEENVKGIDLNANFGYDLGFGGEIVDLGLNIRANHLIERSSTLLDDQGNAVFDDVAGEFGFPSWTGRATATIGYKDLTLSWQTRYIGEVAQDPAGVDAFSDAFGNGPDGEPTGFISDTCTGGGSPNGVVEGDGRFCRDVGFADDYFVHTVSLRYEFNDDITLRAGVTNVFDKKPPLIDTDEVFGISNTPIGNGYDFDGREYFGSISVRF
ncbi:TonB-dependent receptor domain-containing protein [Aurantiacibacter spongiae]|uniref:TonB-dependent receptor n=1 Tax=Aurantiacibacter spongiae TaxID=2488860 RepID=A0A3N5CS70_9SPHN|nr:TonB-dependent receptor [Aurantiacibacter spongiae]RPF72003.1 TonB-dependent receptor [Aurantiacibacter spongiae]